VAADIFDFWLDGHANTAGTLKSESFQFPPDTRGVSKSIDFYPIATSLFGIEHLEDVRRIVNADQIITLWDGIVQRIQNPTQSFPFYSPNAMRGRVPIGSGTSTLTTGGSDWIYPDITNIIMKHPLQGLGPSSTRHMPTNPARYQRTDYKDAFDIDLFPLGGLDLLSEVEVSALPATVTLPDGQEVDGYIVTLDSWRCRVYDDFNFNAGHTQPVPPGVEVPDQLFLDMQASPCKGTPTPADFFYMTDSWFSLSVANLEITAAFVTSQPVTLGGGGDFAPAASQASLFELTTFEEIKL
jgi:hypothetical protein